MKQRLTLFAGILICSFSSFAQSIKGKVKLNEDWKQAIYLIEVSRYGMLFSGSSNNVVDSFYLSSEGYFYFNNLKPNTLYRLNVTPAGSTIEGQLIQDGTNDNYSFFITNGSKHQLYFTADIKQLFRSGLTLSSDKDLDHLQKQIASINKIKLPVYNTMASLGDEMSKVTASDTAAMLAFQQKAITRIMAINAETNVQLQQYLQQVKNAEVLSYGLINCGFENDASNKDIIALVQKLRPYKSHPLAQSIITGMQEVSKSIEHSFLSKDYPLINGGSIRMNTISSRFILMDFWASWCMPCRKSIRGDLKMLRADFKEDELFILGINTDQNKQSALQAIEKDDNKNTQVWDGGTNELYNYFNVKALPHYILIDTKTQDIKVLGPADMVNLKSKLKEMLGV